MSLIEFVTLDGVMQSFGSPDEDRDGGFEHGGWGAPYADESMFTASADGLGATTAYLFGRRTYEKMNAFWPRQSDESPMAAHLSRTPKYVATRTLKEIAGGLVDGYTLYVHPLVLGTGKRLFREYARPLRLHLANCTPTRSGVLVLSYTAE